MRANDFAKLSKKRTGIIGIKLGMSAYFDDNGNRFAVTLVKVEPNVVTEVNTSDKHGFNSVQVAIRDVSDKKLNKPQRVELNKKSLGLKSIRRQFNVSPDCMLQVGDVVAANHFVEGQVVDVSAKSIGKGFAGVMKRHNFGGLRASHGVSISHRSHGSTGQCQDPGRVFKGKKMAGQLGNKKITTQNLKVIAVDTEKSVLIIKGAVPGAEGSVVAVTDALKKALPSNVAMPAGFKQDVKNNDNTAEGHVSNAETIQAKESK